MISARAAVDGRGFALTVEGHAGFAPKGQDIVCAAVSGLVYALAGGLRSLGERPEVRLAPGECRICCAGGREARAMLRMAAVGLAQLAETYPEHVVFSVEGTDKNRRKTAEARKEKL